MASEVINDISIEHLKAANYIAVGIGTTDVLSSDTMLSNEVVRSPISDILYGEEYIEFRALFQQEDLPDEAIREVGVFWEGSSQLDRGLLLYRSTVFAKQLIDGNDLYFSIRIMTIVSVVAVTTARPDIPATPTATSPTPKSVKVEWVPPFDGNVDITTYQVRYKETGTSSWTTKTGIRGLQYTIHGLTTETEYDAQVQAINAIGASGWSGKVVHETIPEFALDSGVLFIVNRESVARSSLWRLNDLDAPSGATKLYDLSIKPIGGVAYDGEALFIVYEGNNSTRTWVQRITNFTTTSPVLSPVKQIVHTSYANYISAGLVYAENMLVVAITHFTLGRTRIFTISDFNNFSPINRGVINSYIGGLTYDGNRFLAISRANALYEFDPFNPSLATLIYDLPLTQVQGLAWNGWLIIGDFVTDELYTIVDVTNPVLISKGSFPPDLDVVSGMVWAAL